MATSVAPVITPPSAPDTNPDINSLMSGIIAESVASVSAPPVVEKPRDEQGRFVSPTGEQIPQAQPVAPADAQPPVVPAAQPSQGEPPAEGQPGAEGAAPVLPEGFVAAKPIEGRELATKFTIADASGEIEVPDLTITFKANGRERTESIDKVVRFAEMGVYNAERQAQFDTIQRNSDHVAQQNDSLVGTIQQQRQFIDQLLSDDATYLQERANHEAQNTPEAKAQRAEAERDFANAARAGESFYLQHVSPGIEQITQALPEVTRDELEARVLLINQRYLIQTPHGTIFHPNAHGQIAQSIVREIVPWAQHLHAERAADKPAPAQHGAGKPPVKAPVTPQNGTPPAESAQVRKLQAENQQLRNQGTRAQRPPRTTGPAPMRDVPKPKPITNVEDAASAALDETFAAMGMTRPRGS